MTKTCSRTAWTAAIIAVGLALPAVAETRSAPAPAPAVRSLPGGRTEVTVSADCVVQYNDLGVRDSRSADCTAQEVAAANEALTRYLKAAYSKPE
ncbi:MAG: hypothetical protein LJE69_03430 [Thiohalocapsa sp.]|jgi:hypothetical protein|uniref:hypothetical protein n=1 Tax=Thiohalocapsa sp. TaxID=2497641 RepID=UPI0025EE659F|nr:hypothetical protein [Thiohalocapsa sp.]MCG6940286.1 hypothetical protein [Thiohalocapsa sp.]